MRTTCAFASDLSLIEADVQRRLRALVERLFGLMKRCCSDRRVRHRGLGRNRAQLLPMGMAITLRRAERLLCG